MVARTRSEVEERTFSAGETAKSSDPQILKSVEHVFDAIEQVPLFVLVLGVGPWLELFLGQRLRELLEHLTLFLVQPFRRNDLNGGKKIAAPAAADFRHPLAAQPKRRACLCPFGDAHRLAAVERRHLDFAAK